MKATNNRILNCFLNLAAVVLFLSVIIFSQGGSCKYFITESQSGSSANSIPNGPAHLAVSIISETALALTWQDNSKVENGYIIERRTGITGSFVTIAQIGANLSCYTDTDVAPGFIYYYRVASFNSTSNSAYSNEDSNLPGIAVFPNPPNGAVNIPINPVLSWTASAKTISYDVYFGVTSSDWSPITNTADTIFLPALAIDQLGNETKYFWRIDSRNFAGITFGAVWTFTTQIETISTPNQPVGTTSGQIGTDYSYFTGGASSSASHTIEYQFDWNGDGTDLSGWGPAYQLKTWSSAGTYSVRARARCQEHTSAVSEWSLELYVNIAFPWTKQFGTRFNDYASSVTTDPSGNIYVAGTTFGGLDENVNAGLNDGFIIKYNSSGVKQWTRQIGTALSDLVYGVSTDAGGNIYMAGATEGGLDGNASSGGFDGFVVKYNYAGVKQWTKQFGTTATDYAYGVATDASGNIYAVGSTEGGLDGNTNAGYIDAFVVKYNSAGIKQWTRQLGTFTTDYASGVATDTSGNIYVAGYTAGGLDGIINTGGGDGFIVKYNSAGVKQWTNLFGSPFSDSARGIATDLSGNIFIIGETTGRMDGTTNAGEYDGFVVKYNSAGIKQWTRQFGTSFFDAARGVAADANGNIYVTGHTYGDLDGNTNAGGDDAYVIKYDSTGEKQWTKQFGTSSSDSARGIATDLSGNIFVAGETWGGLDGNINAGGGDGFMIKYNSDMEPLIPPSQVTSPTPADNAIDMPITQQLSWTAATNAFSYDIYFGTINPPAYLTNTVLTYFSPSVYTGSDLSYSSTYYWRIDSKNSAGTTPGVVWSFTTQAAETISTPDQPTGTTSGTTSISYSYTAGGSVSNLGHAAEYQFDWKGDGTDLSGWGPAYQSKTWSSAGTYSVRARARCQTHISVVSGWSLGLLVNISAPWTKQFGTANTDYAFGVVTDANGNIYVSGYTDGGLDGNTNAGGWDGFVIKYNLAGEKQWTRQFGTSSFDYAESVATDADGNIYVTGYTYGNLDGNISAGLNDGFLIKYNSTGEKQWTKQFGTANNDFTTDVAIDLNGNVYVAGETYGQLDGNINAGYEDAFVVKFNSAGVQQWTRQFGTITSEYSSGIATDADGNIYVTGYTYGNLDGNTNAGDWDGFVVKYNSDGVKQWTRLLGTIFTDAPFGICTDINGNIYITGFTEGGLDGNTYAGGRDGFLVKYDSAGAKLWTKQIGTIPNDTAVDIAADPNGNLPDGQAAIYVVGWTYGELDGNTNIGGTDGFLAKYNSAGDKQWTRQFGTISNDAAFSIDTDLSGNLYIVGYTYGNLDGNTNAGDWDGFVVKYNSAGVKQ